MTVLGLLLLVVSAFPHQPAAVDPALQAVHNALFSSYIPIEELRTDQRLEQTLLATRDQLWQAASEGPDLKRLLLAFQDLRPTEHVCGTANYLDPVQGLFSALTPAQRRRVLFLLQICESNEVRRLAMSARNFYVSAVYGVLQERLAGTNLNVYAPASFAKQHRLNLPASRLRYDAARREIIRNDGPIDYLIVGSGAAGSVLAHELRNHGKRVLLIERGPLVVPGSMDTREVGELIDKRMTSDGGILVQNGKTVGGGTTVNIDLCFAPTGADVMSKIDGWRRDGLISESDFTAPQLKAAYEWVKAAMATRVVPESEINANNRVLWEGALQAGLHPKLYDLNTYAPGASPYSATDKRSAETQLLIPALNDAGNPLNLLSSVDVRRVLFEDEPGAKKAVGVEVLMRSPPAGTGIEQDLNGLAIPVGVIVQIHANTVILCAGALGSPAILLRSGVQNDQIGRGVVLHVSMPVIGQFDKTIDAFRGTRASVYVDDNLIGDGYALECMSAEPVYAALMSPGSPLHVFDLVKSYRSLAGFGVMLIDTPSKLNRVTMDPQGEPQIAYTLSESDTKRFRRGIAKAIQVMFLGGAKQVYLPTTENIVGDNPADSGELEATIVRSNVNLDQAVGRLQFVPNRTLLTSAHMQGTNKMGRDPATSVVSTDFHVWGTKQLYVVDASVFPTSIGANPMQSVYTFAKIFADHANAVN